jgi:succinyl-CoA synthetase beta subunit
LQEIDPAGDGAVKLHEYQSKSLFALHGIPVPPGSVVATPKEARRAADDLGAPVAVKAQVLAGGRGKAGGIRLAANPTEAEEAAAEILGREVKGLSVHQLLVEAAADIRQEVYLGVAIDRHLRQVVIMASAEGGVEIEQVVRNNPQAVKRAVVDPFSGLSSAQTLALAKNIGLSCDLYAIFDDIVCGLYQTFLACDALLAEINPLVVTGARGLLALDGKVVIDDNALFRHPALAQMRNTGEETSAERRAREAGLSYVYLGGDIGCMVNGAGLAMATVDTISLFGGAPANFLDVGGGARAERVEQALRLILSVPGIRVMLVNIFGGITRCDEVAQGIVAALKALGPSVPMVVRLVGTNEEQGREILGTFGQRLIVADTLVEAAQKAVSAVREMV